MPSKHAAPLFKQFTKRLIKLPKHLSFKRLRGGLLFVLGYLLSPLCWWNDLIFNLPVAYGFGYLCSLVSAGWLLPGLIAGYWLSNVLGFVLMQFGAVDALQAEAKPRNPQKELLMGVVSSTIYTLVILALVQLQVIDTASLLPGELLNLGSLLPTSRGLG
ncbi:hypothetical protein HJG54_29115 [Leptolyngbya sp. NK1-12]|uniref:Uncharacterized protein n=2 Tax=Leptolyngbya sp. NK1-12 TaxID=2547451 RepID=A0AA97APK1_9CYAN|nr:hypothetical protein HJG54_29115 [Leptolyngbya sp. NK1-12]